MLKNKFEPTIFKRTPSFNCSKENLNNCSSFRGELSLQTRTKLQKVLKRTLSCCKIQIVFKNQRNPLNVFHSKDRLPYDLVSCIVYKFQCGRCNASYYGETDMHLKVRSVEHIGISPLTFEKVKPSAGSSICDHLLFCNYDSSFDDFPILAQGTNKFLLEIKESLLIKRDKPILNRNISSAPLFLFDKVYYDWIISIIINCIILFLSRCFYVDKRVLFCGFAEKLIA